MLINTLNKWLITQPVANEHFELSLIQANWQIKYGKIYCRRGRRT
ncbi:hypothetical protein O983_27290 [Mycobacterium avium 09-5983]|nr:hypothetical protein O983_27290 [Mycobacterium avium 09-5983]KDP00639.1 hypothetical protein MAV3388_09210 [Mycobacterium avium subsp. hominissuis 3388]